MEFGSDMNGARQQRGNRGGFSLVELLMVMAIIVLVMALVVPAASSLRSSFALNAAGQAVFDSLALARQSALTRNQVVAMRFYHSVNGGAFEAFQLVVFDADGSERPLNRVNRLSDGLILSRNARHSSLLQDAPGRTFLPGAGEMAYAELRFRRDGSADLDSSQLWFLTVTNEREEETEVPKNYVSFLVEPGNGTVRVCRP